MRRKSPFFIKLTRRERAELLKRSTTLRDQLMRFQQRYQQSAKPFEWRFTRRDLDALLEKIKQKSLRFAA